MLKPSLADGDAGRLRPTGGPGPVSLVLGVDANVVMLTL